MAWMWEHTKSTQVDQHWHGTCILNIPASTIYPTLYIRVTWEALSTSVLRVHNCRFRIICRCHLGRAALLLRLLVLFGLVTIPLWSILMFARARLAHRRINRPRSHGRLRWGSQKKWSSVVAGGGGWNKHVYDCATMLVIALRRH